MDLPPRENILDPWLPVQGLAMIHAPRGVGKTFLALNVGYAISAGASFLRWQAPKPRGVLYLDGEMPAATIQERILTIANEFQTPPKAAFNLMTPDLQPLDSPLLNLGTMEGQARIDRHITDDIDLVIVDNISTLCRSGKENEAHSWDKIQAWALGWRKRGKAVLFVHHSGKSGRQRGTSKKEDVLDTVIFLRPPLDRKPSSGARFQVIFEKQRGFYGRDAEPFEAELIDGQWLVSSMELSTYQAVVRLAAEGLSKIEIAQELNIHKSTAGRHYRKAQERGDILIKDK